MANRRGRIIVAAGTNGAGKSSIAGEYFSQTRGYYNPDLRTRDLIAAGLTADAANAQSWNEGFGQLRHAIDSNQDFTFETTLGGKSIVAQLHRAAALGRNVCLWYVGLESPEMHIARVKARVARGGHNIPEGKIRERYTASLTNLIGLIGVAAAIHVFDNSQEDAKGLPQVKLVVRMKGEKITEPSLNVVMSSTPDWAKPVVAAALKLSKIPSKRATRRLK